MVSSTWLRRLLIVVCALGVSGVLSAQSDDCKKKNLLQQLSAVLGSDAFAVPEPVNSLYAGMYPDRPPVGVSAFDRLFPVLPQSFGEMQAVAGRLAAGQPSGRSLARDAVPDEGDRRIRSPRIEITSPDGLIFIAYVPEIDSLEVISWNRLAGRYEFQLVEDAFTAPRVTYANRALCVTCHQNQAGIFAHTPWSESIGGLVGVGSAHSGNLTAARAFAREHGIALGFNGIELVENASDASADRVAAHLLVEQGCRETVNGVSPAQCRAELVKEIYTLSGRSSARRERLRRIFSQNLQPHLGGDGRLTLLNGTIEDPSRFDPAPPAQREAALQQAAKKEEGGICAPGSVYPMCPGAGNPIRDRAESKTPADALDWVVHRLRQDDPTAVKRGIKQVAKQFYGRELTATERSNIALNAEVRAEVFRRLDQLVVSQQQQEGTQVLTGTVSIPWINQALRSGQTQWSDDGSHKRIHVATEIANEEMPTLKPGSKIAPLFANCAMCHRGAPGRLGFLEGKTEQEVWTRVRRAAPEIARRLDWTGTHQGEHMPPASSPFYRGLAANPKTRETIRNLAVCLESRPLAQCQ